MDPLSITASLIAVLSAITASGKGINKLLSLRKAPAEVLALSNEVEALRAVLLIVQKSILQIHGSAMYYTSEEALNVLLKAVETSVLDLDRKVEYQLKRAEQVDQDGILKTARLSWLKAAPEIERLRETSRDARNNLIAGLVAINMEIGETIRRTAVEIQSITVVSQNSAHEQFGRVPSLQWLDEMHESQQMGFRDLASQLQNLYQEVLSKERDAARPLGIAANTSQRSNLATAELFSRPFNSAFNLEQNFEAPANEFASDIIRVNTTIRVRRCARFCKCQCHVSSYLRTPQWLRSTLGQLMFSYTNLIRPKPCNYPPCHRSPKKAQVTYMFPRWLASRALIASCTVDNLNGSVASWATRMPIVLPLDHRVWPAVINGNLRILRTLFANREATPTVVTERGDNLLHLAVGPRHREIRDFLLQQGVAEDSENQGRETAVELALKHGAADFFQYDVDAVAEDLCFSPLHVALTLPSGEVELSDELLDQQYAYINAPDKFGMTPLHWASRMGNSDAVSLLLKWKADTSLITLPGNTALHEACFKGDISCVDLLLKAGCNVNTPDQYGRTPLFYLAETSGSAAIVDLLVQHRADVNHADLEYQTPLHGAAFDHTSLIPVLVRSGAQVNAVDRLRNSPMHLAILYNQTSSIKALWKASKQAKVRISLISGSADLGGRSSYVSLRRPAGLVTKLTRAQVQLTWGVNHNYQNALHLAALCCTASAMQRLAGISLIGIDPMAKNRDGNTPTELFYRCRNEHCTVSREPFDVEEKAWKSLVQSACRQNDIDPTILETSGAVLSRLADVKIVESGDSDEDYFTDAAEDLDELR